MRKMDLDEFRNEGFLQEVNRQFFHPLGLALEMILEDDKEPRLGGVWDYREDPEGMIYHKDDINEDHIENIEKLRKSKEAKRIEILGEIIQTKD